MGHGAIKSRNERKHTPFGQNESPTLEKENKKVMPNMR